MIATIFMSTGYETRSIRDDGQAELGRTAQSCTVSRRFGGVTKDGKPVAALVDYPLFERIRQLRDSFDQLTARMGQIYADVHAELAQTEIDEAVRHVRRTRRRE